MLLLLKTIISINADTCLFVLTTESHLPNTMTGTEKAFNKESWKE